MSTGSLSDFSALQQLLRKPVAAAPGERCDFCALPIGPGHAHLVDTKARRIMCGCRPCAITFQPDGAALGRFKLVPERFARVDDLALDDATWDALQIPIGLAFFLHNSTDGAFTAFYPGPAGATESELPLDAWQTIAERHPVLSTLRADVEAIVLRRRGATTDCYLVPIDAAYELVGLIRSRWRGFDGGDDARAGIDAFFDGIERRT
ncbi:MAG: DUF5947 family protein [Vulcanimicrobiaceae bacterium]